MMGFLRRLWHGETNGVTTAAVIVGIASLASRLLGIVRDHALASVFGAGPELDAYYAAFRLPDFLYNLIILGALTAGFIPVFTEYLERKSAAEAWKLAEEVLSVVGAIMAVSCIVLALTAPWVVPWTTPGFKGDLLALTVNLSRIMFLSPFLLGLSAVMGGILQSTRRFLAFSLAPLLYNLGIIFGAVVLSRYFGVMGVAWGVIIGAALHLIAQATVAIRLGIRHIPWPSFKPEGVRRILKLMAPRTAGLAVTQFNLVILLALASSLESGSVSVFNLANNLQSFPIGIIGVSFAVAAFPALSRAAGRQSADEFRRAFGDAARKIFYLLFPTTFFMLLLRAQIVRLILGDGKFDWNDTIRTATLLGWFSVSILAQALIPLLARAFYAIQNTWTPFWIGVIAEAVNIGSAYLLRKPYGITGLAIAFSLAAFVQMALLWIWLRRRRGALGEGSFSVSAFKTFIATACALGIGYLLRQWVGTIYPLHTYWQVALQACASGFGGIVAYFAVSWMIKSREFIEFKDGALRKWHALVLVRR